MAEWDYDPFRADVEVLRGDSWSWLASLQSRDNENSPYLPVDLTTATGEATIRSEPGAVVVATPTVTITSVTDGEWEVTLSAAETADLPPGTYRWAVRITWLSGTVRTVVTGTCVVRPSLVTP